MTMASQHYAPVATRTTSSVENSYQDDDENDDNFCDELFEDNNVNGAIELPPVGEALADNDLGDTVRVSYPEYQQQRRQKRSFSTILGAILVLVIVAGMASTFTSKMKHNGENEEMAVSSPMALPTCAPSRPPPTVKDSTTTSIYNNDIHQHNNDNENSHDDDLHILRNYFPLNLLSMQATQIWIDGDVTLLSGHPRPIMGQIPTQIGLLTKLTYLELEDHPQITGTIPTQVGLLTKLTSFILTNNRNLTGKIPPELGLLSSTLVGIILSKNDLTGTLPSGIASLTNLASLDVRANRLTGTIPFLPSDNTEDGGHSLITSLSNLEWLELSDNPFESGTIPTEIGFLTKLTSLRLGGCQLSGTIPTELGLLSRLTWLRLPANDLTGTLPTELGQLALLTDLDVRNNTELSETIPSTLHWLVDQGYLHQGDE